MTLFNHPAERYCHSSSGALFVIKMLSIITISYRDSRGLSDTLTSLRPWFDATQQGGGGYPWEHLIVDSSPADNESVLANLPDGWPVRRIIVPAEGIYAAFNAGIRAASGSAIWFLNGGDRLHDRELLKNILMRLNADAGQDLICCGARLMRKGSYLYDRKPRETLKKSVIGANSLPHQGVVYRRSVFERIGPFDVGYRIGGDYHHHFRCLIGGLHALCWPNALVECDMGGISSENYQESLRETARIHREMGRQLPFALRLWDGLAFRVEWLRVYTVKFLARSPIQRSLRPFWLAYNRWRK